MNTKIEVGQIWKVTSDTFFTSGEKNKFERPVNILKDEFIEIRYPYEWHFRTYDNHYFHAKPEMIHQNCILHGVIWRKVRFANNCDLKIILDKELFDKVRNRWRIKN